MSSTAHVSVVIPTRDRSTMLSVTLRSVVWQQDVDLEVIVIDDGSIDDTASVVRGLDDERVRLVRHESPQGVSSARNRGIEEARGDWVAFLDDDDVWAPTKLEAQLAVAAETHRGWIYAGAVKVDDRLRIVGGTPPPPAELVVARLPRWNLVPGGCSGVIASRAALTSAGSFDRRLINIADWDLWIRLGQTGPPGRVSEPLVGYRFHPGQASLDVALTLAEIGLLDRRYGAAIDRGALHHYIAHRCLRAGDRWQALKHFGFAAVGGELGPVANTLGGVIRERLGGKLHLPRPPDPHGGWRARAETWLAELRGAVTATVEP